ncbi:MAG: hypothetical protein JSR44_12010 [Spirochaetes bacterium]|nr:hypothetical protein [Spirochaetota bacterium]
MSANAERRSANYQAIGHILSAQRSLLWFDTLQAKVGFILLLLVFLAIPAFFLMVKNTMLVVYYLAYPVFSIFGLYLRARGREYLANTVTVTSVFGVVAWLAWLADMKYISPLSWWILTLLPWVMFTDKQRFGLFFYSALPLAWSFIALHVQLPTSPLLPAEREFTREILNLSVGLGAFSCIFFLRRQYLQSEESRQTEADFYTDTLHAIPLPIIIKDGITLDYLFFNEAARMTYDLNRNKLNTNATTFSASCSAAVSRLDHEVLRSITYHIEANENLVHQTGIHWHFRTYRIPLESKDNGRKLLIAISEDLRALDVVLRQAERNHKSLDAICRLMHPILFHYDLRENQLQFDEPLANEGRSAIHPALARYVEYYVPRLTQHLPITTLHRFSVEDGDYIMFHAFVRERQQFSGVIFRA